MERHNTLKLKHTKPYVVIFNKYDSETHRCISCTITEFDNKANLKEEELLLNNIYKEELKNNCAGYAIFDFNTKKIKYIAGAGIYIGNSRFTSSDNKLILHDLIFRTQEEVPDDYLWDIGEYEGWLQYRWGDGKNAIN